MVCQGDPVLIQYFLDSYHSYCSPSLPYQQIQWFPFTNPTNKFGGFHYSVLGLWLLAFLSGSAVTTLHFIFFATTLYCGNVYLSVSSKLLFVLLIVCFCLNFLSSFKSPYLAIPTLHFLFLLVWGPINFGFATPSCCPCSFLHSIYYFPVIFATDGAITLDLNRNIYYLIQYKTLTKIKYKIYKNYKYWKHWIQKKKKH